MYNLCSYRYADIDDLAPAGAKVVDLPTSCKGRDLGEGACCGESVYDTIEIPRKLANEELEDEDENAGEYMIPSTAVNPTVFAPDFLKKDSDLSKTYNNNLYGIQK